MVHPLLVTAMLLTPALLGAQSHPLVGSWKIEIPAGFRTDEGGATVPVMAKGTFTFEIVGDSIIGTLKHEPPEGQPARPATRVATKLVTGPVTFAHRAQARMVMNGEEQIHTANVTYVFNATGDALQGSLDRRLEGVNIEPPGPQDFTGTRVKGS